MDIQLAKDVRLPMGHARKIEKKTGILLINLGTPDATNYRAMRRYLSQFLSDRRVIELSPLIWQPILQAIILTFRPKKSGHAYDQIWNQAQNESPLRTFTRSQARGLEETFVDHPEIVIDWAMRYGNPSIESRVRAMQQQGCQNILAMALYPQYAASTTATAYDALFDSLKKLRWQPTIRCVAPYYDHPAYIEALAKTVEQRLSQHPHRPDCIVASFHGLPQEYFAKGDPYYCHCAKTTRLLRTRLGMKEDQLIMTFQSRFGPKAWLQPYTDETLKTLAHQGKKSVMVITPGFASDCVETLEEIAIGVKETFMEEGGEAFDCIPCLNDQIGGIDMLAAICRENLHGWIKF